MITSSEPSRKKATSLPRRNSTLSSSSAVGVSSSDSVKDPTTPTKFTIPRRKKHSLLQQVPEDSRESKDVHRIVKQSYSSRGDLPSGVEFSFSNVQVVHNSRLRQEYCEWRSEMRNAGYTDADLRTQYCFIAVSDLAKAERLCEKGLECGQQRFASLGDPQLGVYLYRHADAVCESLLPQRHVRSESSPEKLGFLVIFVTTRGRVKTVIPRHDGEDNVTKVLLEPTPNYDCHVSRRALDSDQWSGKQTVRDSQVKLYFFEFGEEDMKKRPRQCCPFAVVRVSRQPPAHKSTLPSLVQPGTRKRSIPSRKNPADDKSTSHRHLFWSGPLMNLSQYLLKIELYTSTTDATLPANCEFGSEITLKGLVKKSRLSTLLHVKSMDDEPVSTQSSIDGMSFHWLQVHATLPGNPVGAQCHLWPQDCAVVAKPGPTSRLYFIASDTPQHRFLRALWVTGGCSKSKRVADSRCRGVQPLTGEGKSLLHVLDKAQENFPMTISERMNGQSSVAEKDNMGGVRSEQSDRFEPNSCLVFDELTGEWCELAITQPLTSGEDGARVKLTHEDERSQHLRPHMAPKDYLQSNTNNTAFMSDGHPQREGAVMSPKQISRDRLCASSDKALLFDRCHTKLKIAEACVSREPVNKLSLVDEKNTSTKRDLTIQEQHTYSEAPLSNLPTSPSGVSRKITLRQDELCGGVIKDDHPPVKTSVHENNTSLIQISRELKAHGGEINWPLQGSRISQILESARYPVAIASDLRKHPSHFKGMYGQRESSDVELTAASKSGAQFQQRESDMELESDEETCHTSHSLVNEIVEDGHRIFSPALEKRFAYLWSKFIDSLSMDSDAYLSTYPDPFGNVQYHLPSGVMESIAQPNHGTTQCRTIDREAHTVGTTKDFNFTRTLAASRVHPVCHANGASTDVKVPGESPASPQSWLTALPLKGKGYDNPKKRPPQSEIQTAGKRRLICSEDGDLSVQIKQRRDIAPLIPLRLMDVNTAINGCERMEERDNDLCLQNHTDNVQLGWSAQSDSLRKEKRSSLVSFGSPQFLHDTLLTSSRMSRDSTKGFDCQPQACGGSYGEPSVEQWSSYDELCHQRLGSRSARDYLAYDRAVYSPHIGDCSQEYIEDVYRGRDMAEHPAASHRSGYRVPLVLPFPHEAMQFFDQSTDTKEHHLRRSSEDVRVAAPYSDDVVKRTLDEDHESLWRYEVRHPDEEAQMHHCNRSRKWCTTSDGQREEFAPDHCPDKAYAENRRVKDCWESPDCEGCERWQELGRRTEWSKHQQDKLGINASRGIRSDWSRNRTHR